MEVIELASISGGSFHLNFLSPDGYAQGAGKGGAFHKASGINLGERSGVDIFQ